MLPKDQLAKLDQLALGLPAEPQFINLPAVPLKCGDVVKGQSPAHFVSLSALGDVQTVPFSMQSHGNVVNCFAVNFFGAHATQGFARGHFCLN